MGLRDYSEAVTALAQGDQPLAEEKMAKALSAEKLPSGALEALAKPNEAIEGALLRQLEIAGKKHG